MIFSCYQPRNLTIGCELVDYAVKFPLFRIILTDSMVVKSEIENPVYVGSDLPKFDTREYDVIELPESRLNADQSNLCIYLLSSESPSTLSDLAEAMLCDKNSIKAYIATIRRLYGKNSVTRSEGRYVYSITKPISNDWFHSDYRSESPINKNLNSLGKCSNVVRNREILGKTLSILSDHPEGISNEDLTLMLSDEFGHKVSTKSTHWYVVTLGKLLQKGVVRTPKFYGYLANIDLLPFERL